MSKALIVGLGNPGKSYVGTRHNIGFAVVEKLAQKHGLKFKKEPKFKGEIAVGTIGHTSTILAQPLTYMNLSGETVELVMSYYQFELSRLIVVVDDVALPLGQLRIKTHSGSGGHNGLKSIESHLQTNGYARLKIGVNDRESGNLADHVLGPFSKEENKLLPGVLERAVHALEIWLDKGLTSAMDFANPSTPSIGDKNE